MVRSLVLCGAAGVLVCGLGCSQGERLTGSSPTSPTAPPLPEYRRPIQITSGADQAPVAHARVLINDEYHESDQNGQVQPDFYTDASMGATFDVEAPGFLPRKTRIPADRVITLWPAADDTEADAIRQMVYGRGAPFGEVLVPVEPLEPFYVTLEPTTPDVEAAWKAGAESFGARFKLTYSVGYAFNYSTNEIAVSFADDAACPTAATLGLCPATDSPYRRFIVLRRRARDPRTIQRVIASWFIGPNPLPGLMNAVAPTDDFSALEIQTIRMILQRPRPNRWPDTDR